jgi:phospholipase D1/2
MSVQMGSANFNDRSQRVMVFFFLLATSDSSHLQGDGDSEIALVVEDDDMIRTTMNGKPYEASRFAASLRRKLYRG